jgi:hypothetical protein
MRSSSTQKRQTNSSQNLADSSIRNSKIGYSPSRIAFSPGKSDGIERQSMYDRFKRKDLR